MTEVNPATAALQDQQSALRQLPPHLLRQFSDMALMLPETESDGGASILEAILNAADMRATNDVWAKRDLGAYKDRVIIIESASRSKSDFKDGLGIFVVVSLVLEDTGEAVTATTGSMSNVAQIVKAYANEEFPLRCIVRVAERASQSGYFPQHLEVTETQPPR